MTLVANALQWSIKRQFLRYIASMADGRCSVTDGADLVLTPSRPGISAPERAGGEDEIERSAGAPEASRSDQFSFGFTGHEVGQRSVTVSFCGDVRFSGHYGFLFVRIADPAIEVGPDRNGVLTIASPDPTEPDASRIPFARLRISEDARVGTQVRLTRQGAELFGGAYDESEPLDDLALPVSAARAVLATFARLETAHPDSNGSRDRAPHNP
jgi:hypothetical protein